MVAYGISKNKVETLDNASDKKGLTMQYSQYAHAGELQHSSYSDSVYSGFNKAPVVWQRRFKLRLLIYMCCFSITIVAASAAAIFMSTRATLQSDRLEATLRMLLENFNAGDCGTVTSERLESNEPSSAGELHGGKQNAGDATRNITSASVRPRQQLLASAHVSGAKLTNDNNFALISNWSVTNSSDSFCSMIKHRDGRLVVLHAGLYYVYSQVQFLNYPADDLGSTHAQLSHSVCRWNVVYPNDGIKIVMKRTMTARWPLGTDVDQRASYLGGVYALRAGDEVFVRLSKSGVRNESQMTFFGMFAIQMNSA